MKTVVIITILFSFQIKASSQIDNIMAYLDDNERSTSKDIVLTDLTQIIQSNIMVMWEHKFKRPYSIQLGLGYVPYQLYSPAIKPTRYKHPINAGLKNGFSWIVKPSLLLDVIDQHDGFEGFYLAFPFKQQIHPGQIKASTISATCGRKWFINDAWMIDIEVGYGVRIEKSLDNTSYFYKPKDTVIVPSNSRLFIPVSLKVGYRI